jgi:hypothetical protein
VCGRLVIFDCIVCPFVRLSNPLKWSGCKGGCCWEVGCCKQHVSKHCSSGACKFIEKVLVAMLCLMMKIHHLKKGKLKLRGKTISFSQPEGGEGSIDIYNNDVGKRFMK